MFALLGIIPLLAIVYVRPQEFVAGLDRVPLLYLGIALTALGGLIDVRLRALRPIAAPPLVWIVALVAWIAIGVVVGLPPDAATEHLTAVFVSFALYFSVAHSAQTLRAIELVAGALVALALAIALIGIHQGLAPLGCVLLDASNPQDSRSGSFDGRRCQIVDDCGGPDAEPGGEYVCEHIGLFGTTSADQRIRYRGILQDPNELALATACALPLLFALAAIRRRWRWRIAAALGAAAILVCVVMTRSRSGQLVVLAVLGTYFVRYVGWRGIPVILALCLPVLILGGRGGGEAEMSAEFRLESWRTALELAKQHPLTGVGQGMFVEHHFLTAHNSYLLAAAELGLVGMLLWSIPVYLAVKIPLSALRELRGVPEARVARVWASALLASMTGLLAGMLFLSLAYHAVLWIYLGLCSALALAVARHRPDWRVRFRFADLAVVIGIDVGLLVASDLFLSVQGF